MATNNEIGRINGKALFRVLMVLAAGGLLNGCAGGLTPIPDQNSPGARLYAEKCSACHALAHPKRHTAAEWPHLLALMEQRMAERGMPPLTAEERQRLTSYLQRHAR